MSDEMVKADALEVFGHQEVLDHFLPNLKTVSAPSREAMMTSITMLQAMAHARRDHGLRKEDFTELEFAAGQVDQERPTPKGNAMTRYPMWVIKLSGLGHTLIIYHNGCFFSGDDGPWITELVYARSPEEVIRGPWHFVLPRD